MDTKLLSDKTAEILENIFKDYRSAKGIANLSIVPSYDPDSDFTQYSENRKELLIELINGVDTKMRPERLVSAVIPSLSYSFSWAPGVYIGEGCYSPEEHAKQHHTLLFGHAKKFSRVDRTVIVFVIFPWSGEQTFSIENTKRNFFKQFAQRFFNDYHDSSDHAKKFNKKFKSTILAGEVSRHLSGIIYLEDKAITSADARILNIDASYFWNANAIQALSGHAFESVMQRRSAYNLAMFKPRTF